MFTGQLGLCVGSVVTSYGDPSSNDVSVCAVGIVLN